MILYACMDGEIIPTMNNYFQMKLRRDILEKSKYQILHHKFYTILIS